ncbi:hypothetical protein [Pseudophaeobacter sp.]|uniref:hypothetical protein n=1 Tax=Pseudophaeobacter sp. TaxID=1971739 RepID=UPI0040591805
MHVVVHIGPYKTGSTAIQAALRSGQQALEQQGCYYYHAPLMPEFALQTLGLSAPEQMVPDLRHRFATLEQAQAWSARCWQEFEAQVQARRPLLSLISSEHFSGLRNPAPLLDRLRRSFSRITVLAYLRAPASLYRSTLQQRIRGNGERLADLPSPLSFVYPARQQLEPFLNLVGRDNMVVRRFGRTTQASQPWDVVADFAAMLADLEPGLAGPWLQARQQANPQADPRANRSLPGALLAWLLTQNELLDSRGPGTRRHQLLARLEQDPALQALPRLAFNDPALPALIEARARPACAWLNQTFLAGQTPLPLAADAPGPETSGPETSPQALRAAQEALRDWLLAQLTPAATQVLARALLTLDPPPRPAPPQEPQEPPCP